MRRRTGQSGSCQRRRRARGGSGAGVQPSVRHPHREKRLTGSLTVNCSVLVQISRARYFHPNTLGGTMNRLARAASIMSLLLYLSSGSPAGATPVDLTVMTQNLYLGANTD